MAINPIGGMGPWGPGGFGPSAWLEWDKLAAEFWRLLKACEFEEAEIVLQKMFEFSRGRAALMAAYDICLAAFEEALAAAVGTAGAIGEGFVLAEGGIIICIAIIGIYALGGGSRPISGSSGGDIAGWSPHPIKRAEEYAEIERMILKNPHQAGGLISAPKANPLSHDTKVAAANMLLKYIKASRA